MSVSVSIDTGGESIEFCRPTIGSYDTRRDFREAADILDGIAADIRRMYEDKPATILRCSYVHPNGARCIAAEHTEPPHAFDGAV